MTMINPWIYWMINDPESIPDINPHNAEEARGCVAGIIGAGISCLIYIFAMVLIGRSFEFEVALWLYVPCTLLFALLTIVLMKVAFKIADKTGKKK